MVERNEEEVVGRGEWRQRWKTGRRLGREKKVSSTWFFFFSLFLSVLAFILVQGSFWIFFFLSSFSQSAEFLTPEKPTTPFVLSLPAPSLSLPFFLPPSSFNHHHTANKTRSSFSSAPSRRSSALRSSGGTSVNRYQKPPPPLPSLSSQVVYIEKKADSQGSNTRN